MAETAEQLLAKGYYRDPNAQVDMWKRPSTNVGSVNGVNGGGMLNGSSSGNITSTLQTPVPGTTTSQLQYAANVADPFASQRPQYIQGLQNLMTGGSSAIAADPSYQNRFNAGLEALSRSQAAQGFLGSGNMMQALVDYGQKAASDEYQNQYSRLSSLAGVDKSSPSAAGSIMAQLPSQNLAEKNSEFNWSTQSQMLPYQLQELAARSRISNTAASSAEQMLPLEMDAARIQNQMLTRQNTEANQSYLANQNKLESLAAGNFILPQGMAQKSQFDLSSGFTPTGYTGATAEELPAYLQQQFLGNLTPEEYRYQQRIKLGLV